MQVIIDYYTSCNQVADRLRQSIPDLNSGQRITSANLELPSAEIGSYTAVVSLSTSSEEDNLSSQMVGQIMSELTNHGAKVTEIRTMPADNVKGPNRAAPDFGNTLFHVGTVILANG